MVTTAILHHHHVTTIATHRFLLANTQANMIVTVSIETTRESIVEVLTTTDEMHTRDQLTTIQVEKIAHILVRMLHQLHLMTADTKIRFEMDEKTAKRAILIPVVAEVQQQDQLPTMMLTNVLKTRVLTAMITLLIWEVAAHMVQ